MPAEQRASVLSGADNFGALNIKREPDIPTTEAQPPRAVDLQSGPAPG